MDSQQIERFKILKEKAHKEILSADELKEYALLRDEWAHHAEQQN